MNFKLSLPQINQTLFGFFLVLLPIDSFPIFPFKSFYRPISLLPLLIILLLNMRRAVVLNKNLFLTIVIVLIVSYFSSKNIEYYEGFKKVTISLFTLLFSIQGIRIGLKSFTNKRDLKYFIYKKSKAVLIALILMGSIQLLGRFYSPFFKISDNITSIFSFRNDPSRIQWFSGEPATGVRMVILFLVLHYITKEKKPSGWLIYAVSGLLILFSGSTFGLLFIVLFFTIQLLITSSLNLKKIIAIGFLLITFFLLINNINDFLPPYAQKKIEIISDLKNDFNSFNIVNIASKDGSFFQRVFNPLIGILIFYDHPILGIGGENYHYYYSDYIHKYFPFALNSPGIQMALILEDIITPKSMFSKVLCEFGIIGFFLIFVFFRIMIKNKTKTTLPLIGYLIALLFNYGAYFYLPIILITLLVVTFKQSTDRSSDTKLNYRVSKESLIS